MKKSTQFSLVVIALLLFSSCQGQTSSLAPSSSLTAEIPTVIPPSATGSPTPTPFPPTATATSIPVSPKSLAGLIVSSPILGAPFDIPNMEPPTTITANGLGIINADGRLISFADAGLFESFSPTGTRIVYQHGMQGETTRYIDHLFVYNAMTGETVEIVDHLENEGGKTVLAWLDEEQKIIYENDYLTVLFEAYGYFQPKQLLKADVRTGRTWMLIKDGFQFDVSPDEKHIAYSTGKLLESKTKTYGDQALEFFGCFQPRIYDIASSTSKPFDMSVLEEQPVCAGYPSWSPDGKRIAWMGYFGDDTFRPIIFNLEDHTGSVYDPMDQKPESSVLPTEWLFGKYYQDPEWVDRSTYWTPSYEIDVETGETMTPRKRDASFFYRRDKYLKSPDGSIQVSMNEEMDEILVSDPDENLLASFSLDELYDGPRQEILRDPYFFAGTSHIVGWTPFQPPNPPESN
jgi:hypothetical protein